jgi:predicted nucleotidyltransferase
LYFNEIKELSKLSDSSLSRILKELVNKNSLSREETKSNTHYKIKEKKLFALEFSKLAYNKFKNLNIGVRSPLKEFLEQLEDIELVVLFGSTSRKEETKESDIDILIVGEDKHIEKSKKNAQLISNYPLNVFRTNMKDYKSNKDYIIKEIKETGFPIYGEQKFYEVYFNEN